MKTVFYIFIILAMAKTAWAQLTAMDYNQAQDPFLQYVSKIWNTTAVSYDGMYRKKSLFEKDTTTTYASVEVLKKHDKVIFLQIISANRDKSLIYSQDTAWAVSHIDSSISFMGVGITEIEGNPLASFFPYSLFVIDTSAYLVERFWETIAETTETRNVSIAIQNKPEEITGIRYEVNINRNDSLISHIVESVEFAGYDDGQYQEKSMYNYRFEKINHERPAYFSAYRMILPDSGEEDKPTGGYVTGEDIILNGLSLLDMNEQPFHLPDDGLIFIDLWYVGCYPCMKAAPVMEKLYGAYKDSIHFYSVNEVDKNLEKIRNFKETLNITFPVLLNRKESLAVQVIGSNAYPAYFIMDGKTGKVIWKGSGYSEDLEMKLRNVFDAN